MFKSIFETFKSDSTTYDKISEKFDSLSAFEKEIKPKLNLNLRRQTNFYPLQKTIIEREAETTDLAIKPTFAVSSDIKTNIDYMYTKNFVNILDLRDIEFEIWCRDFLKKNNYRADLTQGSNDKGIDIKAVKEVRDENGSILYQENIACQCKGYAQTAFIGSPEIRNFLGSMIIAKVRKGYFFTNTRFSDEAVKDVASAKDQGFDIVLFDRDKLTAHSNGLK